MSPAQVIIDVSGLTKRFSGRTVVDNLALKVRQGEIYGFLGPNGSGKTTTIRMICGLLKPDGGSGTCLGYDLIRDSHHIKAQVGYMAQRFSLYEDLTVRENLEFMARMYQVPKRSGRLGQVVERMGLGQYINTLAGNLSGGWKQRLALSACLIHQPKLLLLDEPTAGVDPKARRDFWDQIHQLTAEGITALISTHYMDEAERCHQLAYIAYGHLLASGRAAEITKAEGLTTWAVSGDGLPELAARLRGLDGVDQVVAMGETLHVSGRDAERLRRSLEPFMTPDHEWRQVDTTLEEVFISLMTESEAD